MNQLTINGYTMAYRDEGTGEPLLLVHGFPLSGVMWNPQIEEFKRDYRLIVPDLRGLGQSAAGAPTDRFSSVDEYADDLRTLLDTLGLAKVVFVGLSMGGYIAFAFYRRYPERVRALVLCDTRSEADSEETRQNRYKLIEAVRERGAGAAADMNIPKLFAPAAYLDRTDLVAQLAGLIERTHAPGIIAAAGALAERPDSTPDLPHIAVPTLVVVGQYDQITPAEGARKMAQAIPDWQFSLVPHAGHMSNLENPEFFNQAMLTFLKGLK